MSGIETYGSAIMEDLMGVEFDIKNIKDGDVIKNDDAIFVVRAYNHYENIPDTFSYYAKHNIKNGFNTFCSVESVLGTSAFSFCGKIEDGDVNNFVKQNDEWFLMFINDKYSFNFHDSVLVRNGDDQYWFASIFDHVDENGDFVMVTNDAFKQCIPYSKATKGLIGTKNRPDLC